VLTGPDGSIIWQGDYFPFGQEYAITTERVKNKKRFIGKEKDVETGLSNFGARLMDEASGRFLAADPVGLVDARTGKVNAEMLQDPQRLNRYAYGLNNPYRYVDPDGKNPLLVGALAIGAFTLDAMKPKSTDVSNSMGALDYMDNATLLAPVGMLGVSGGIKSAFEIAKEGGKHAGFLKNNLTRSTEELQKGINSIEKVIAEHQSKIANPSKYIENWSKLDPRQQQSLINKKWPSDIQRQGEQRDILKNILKNRN
jgi:RHS repeat-associated protein